MKRKFVSLLTLGFLMTLSACGETTGSSAQPVSSGTNSTTSSVTTNSSATENSSVIETSSVEDNSSVTEVSSVEDSTVQESSVEESSIQESSTEESSIEESSPETSSQPSSSPDDSSTSSSSPLVATDYVFEYENATHESPDGSWNSGQITTPVEENAGDDTNPTSGGKSLGYMSTGCKETIAFTSNAAGKATLTFRFAPSSLKSDWSGIAEMDLATTISIKVNGTALDLTGKVLNGVDGWNWYSWQNVSFADVDLQQGDNTVVLEIIGAQGPNIDCLTINTTCVLTGASSTGGSTTPTLADVGTGFYVIHGYAWGPGVDKIVLCLNGSVAAADLAADLFTVTATGTTGGAREVTAAYLADANGDAVNATTANYVALDLKLNVTSTTFGNFTFNSYNGCDPFSYSQTTSKNTWDTEYNVEVKLATGKSLKIGDTTYSQADNPFKVVADFDTKVMPDLKDWTEAKSYTHTDSGKTLTYKAYEPTALTADGVKNKLIIWLHGAGEGGTDPDIAILGNDVTNISQNGIQQFFKKDGGAQGAYVLAVQTPTMWMDDGTGAYTANSNSCYTEALKATIDDYLTKNTDIDTANIILGGCSNGGFMTMNMAIHYPSFFHAYYPVCEAYVDSNITDDNITTLKDLNIWFTAAATDTTVDPSTNSTATYKRLKAAGAANVHYSFFEKVMCDESGENIEYMGHWSWIYALRNECTKDQADYNNVAAPSTAEVKLNNKAVSIWEWLANI